MEEFKESLKAVMTTRAGQEVLQAILDQTGVEGSVYSPDERLHLVATGKREVGVWLRDNMKAAAPGTYLTMVKEQIDE